MNHAEVVSALHRALDRMSAEQRYLLDVRVSERALCSWLADYMRQEFDGWDVDPEYNRHGGSTKRVRSGPYGEMRNVVPDIIVHRRGPDGPNLLALEAKTGTSSRIPVGDSRKLLRYKRDLGYQFAAFVRVPVGAHRGGAVIHWL